MQIIFKPRQVRFYSRDATFTFHQPLVGDSLRKELAKRQWGRDATIRTLCMKVLPMVEKASADFAPIKDSVVTEIIDSKTATQAEITQTLLSNVRDFLVFLRNASSENAPYSETALRGSTEPSIFVNGMKSVIGNLPEAPILALSIDKSGQAVGRDATINLVTHCLNNKFAIISLRLEGWLLPVSGESALGQSLSSVEASVDAAASFLKTLTETKKEPYRALAAEWRPGEFADVLNPGEPAEASCGLSPMDSIAPY